MYPPGTRPDVFADGMTYVALVPFIASGSRLGTSLPMLYFGAFPESNIRLYSIDNSVRHGLLFRSLETARLAVVPPTRIGLGIPYSWAKMRVTRSGDEITYFSVRPKPNTPIPGAHTRKAGRTWWVPVSHAPWLLRAAEVVELDDDLLDASGVRPAGEPMRALFSAGVRTCFGRPVLVR
jgi:uncharacterized protein